MSQNTEHIVLNVWFLCRSPLHFERMAEKLKETLDQHDYLEDLEVLRPTSYPCLTRFVRDDGEDRRIYTMEVYLPEAVRLVTYASQMSGPLGMTAYGGDR